MSFPTTPEVLRNIKIPTINLVVETPDVVRTKILAQLDDPNVAADLQRKGISLSEYRAEIQRIWEDITRRWEHSGIRVEEAVGSVDLKELGIPRAWNPDGHPNESLLHPVSRFIINTAYALAIRDSIPVANLEGLIPRPQFGAPYPLRANPSDFFIIQMRDVQLVKTSGIAPRITPSNVLFEGRRQRVLSQIHGYADLFYKQRGLFLSRGDVPLT